MAEPSKGKHHYGASKLRHVQRPPDSNMVAPEIQLATAPESDYGGGDDVDISAEDLALMEKLSTKKHAGSLTAPSQARAAPAQTGPFTRPASAKTEEPRIFARQAFHQAPPKRNESAVKPPVHPDTAIPSVETSSKEDRHQDDRTTPLPSSWLGTAERVTEIPPTTLETTQGLVQNQRKHEEHAPVEATRPEPVQLNRPGIPTETPIVAQPSTQIVPIFKKKRSGTKGNKAKKRAVFAPLNPVPLHSGPSPSFSTTRDTGTLFADDTAVEAKVGAGRPQRPAGDLAVKSQSGKTAFIDCPLEGVQIISAVPIDATNGSPAVDHHHTEPAAQADQTAYIQPSVGPQVDAQQALGIPDVSPDRHDLSPSTPSGLHDQYPQAQQHAPIESQALRDPLPDPAPAAARHNGRFKSCSAFNSLPTHHARSPAQHVLPDNESGNPAPVNLAPPHLERTQEVLHGVSSRAGPVRVTKFPKQSQVPHDVRLMNSALNGGQQTRTKASALDAAVDALRTACLSDQHRLEDQIVMKEKAWESERSSFQTTIAEQLETIAEQRVKLGQCEKDLAELLRKLKSSQRYVSGLQRDHEEMKKSVVTFQEQNKKVLQAQIAEVLKEKEDLQAGLETMVDSCKNSQKSMSRTMYEIQLRYVTALSRENGLRVRLGERVAMYEEEKHRRIELEQQLLPSVQTMQRQLDEGSDTLIEKISGLQASMESQTAVNSRDSTAKACLLILQELQSLPLLTSKDAHKAEAMLRCLYEKTDAGFRLIARDPKNNSIPIEDIRECIREQMQGLQEKILRNDQVIADSQLAREAYQRLATDVDTEKQKNQQLEEQIVLLRHSEATLGSSITFLEQEKDELRIAVEVHQAEPRKSEQKIAELEAQLRTVNEDLRKSNAAAQGHERQILREKLNFCKYRADALVHLANLRKHTWQITDDGKAKTRECSSLKQDVAELRAQLDSAQTKTNQLTTKVSQYDGDMKIIKQEKNDAIEKEGRTRELFQSAKDLNHELQNENHKLSTAIEEARKDLVASKSAEQELASQCFELRKQVNALQDAKGASDRQLWQVQHDSQIRLQQADTDHTASLDDLKSSLKLSEDARKELHAKLRQMDTERKEQIEHHEQKLNAKFNKLVDQSQQEQEKLKVEHRQEMERCEQDAKARVADVTREAQRQLNEVITRNAERVAEMERRWKDAEISTSRTLVSNTQHSEPDGALSSQQSHSGRTRKKVDRETNSMTVIVSSSDRRLESAEGHIRATISDRHRDGSENQTGYFEREYENSFGSQVLLQNQEEQLSVLDPEAEIVSETQDFEHGQGAAAQFEIIESQVIGSDNADQEDLTDLSTIPSEDLSEMLMDVHPTSRQHRHTPKHVSSSSGELRTPEHSAHDKTPEARLTSSRGRPKSRANTASRMMPLPHPDGQRQRTHADQDPGYKSHTRAGRSFTADKDDSPDLMHPNNVDSKRTYDHRSGHDVEFGQKRKASGHVDDSESFKKLRTSAQAFAQRPSSISKSYAPYTPSPTNTPAQNNSNPSPASVTSRRSSYRQSSAAGSRSAAPRLSSTRNTRSKGNRYSERFEDELGRR